MNYIWCISAISAYRDGFWTSSSIGYDDNGFFEVGPSIVRHPDIVSLLRNLGFQTLDPIYDETITSFVYRFQCVVSIDDGDIIETGAASGVPINSDDLAVTRAALEPHSAALFIDHATVDSSLILNLEYTYPSALHTTNIITDTSQSSNHATSSVQFANVFIRSGPSSNIPLAITTNEQGVSYIPTPIHLALSNQITILPTDGFTLQMFINLSERTGAIDLNVIEYGARPLGYTICGGTHLETYCSIAILGVEQDYVVLTGLDEQWQIYINIPPDDGEWHHLAIRFNPDASVDILIDGVLCGSGTNRDILYIDELFHDKLYDGAYRGLVCGIKAYDIARSDDQIFADAKIGIPTLKKGIKYWTSGVSSITLTGKTNVSYKINSGGGNGGSEVGGGGGAYVSGAVISVDVIECNIDNERTILSFTGGSENFDAHNIVVYNGAGGDSNGQSGYLDIDETGTVVISNTGGSGCDDDEPLHSGSGGGGASRYGYGSNATTSTRTAEGRAMPGFSIKPGKGGAAVNPTLGGRTAATAYGKGGDADLLTPQSGNGGCVIFDYDQGTTKYDTPGLHTFNTTGKTNIMVHIVGSGGSGGNCNGGCAGAYVIAAIEDVGNINVSVTAGGTWDGDRGGNGCYINFLETIELIVSGSGGGSDAWDEYSIALSSVDGSLSYWTDNNRYIEAYNGMIGERAKLLGLGGLGQNDILSNQNGALGGGSGAGIGNPSGLIGSLVTIEWD